MFANSIKSLKHPYIHPLICELSKVSNFKRSNSVLILLFPTYVTNEVSQSNKHRYPFSYNSEESHSNRHHYLFSFTISPHLRYVPRVHLSPHLANLVGNSSKYSDHLCLSTSLPTNLSPTILVFNSKHPSEPSIVFPQHLFIHLKYLLQLLPTLNRCSALSFFC